MSTVSNFVDEFADIIATLTSECIDNIVVVGDVNCPGPNSSLVDEELAECFESLDLTQLVTEPTRRTPNVANLLDVFATSSAALVANVNITESESSFIC